MAVGIGDFGWAGEVSQAKEVDVAVQPEAAQFVDSLPHTATGKLLKTALRDQYKDYRLQSA